MKSPEQQNEDLANVIIEGVSEKTKTYDPSLDNEEHKEFESTDKVGYFHMAFKFADGKDKCLFFFGIMCSLLFGAAMPAFCLLFGEMVDGVGGVNSFSSLGDSAIYMVYMAFGVWIASGGMIALLSVFA